ncbi:hypothetical protein PAXRUDRAFT_825864 [Paxillus rubicundulus Ve08.2h10]|uniref:Uncharacterized protein n=1 Tax=Paxillus rubicundulus Ve08.2h10 TaxID=930991 RepID=A0A0D0DFN2_9AGAM|nr:hypothetical protein PAXRUDRAFT_825864 [Paxillus rubicundulus Ve08.2h10]
MHSTHGDFLNRKTSEGVHGTAYQRLVEDTWLKSASGRAWSGSKVRNITLFSESLISGSIEHWIQASHSGQV